MRRIVLILLVVLTALSALAQQHPNQEKGFQPDRLYQFEELDNINTFNGNLVVTLPVGPKYQVNGGLSYGLTLVYNGVPWDALDNGASGVIAYPCRRCNAGMGFLASYGRLVAPHDPTNNSPGLTSWVYESADGRDHRFSGTDDTEPIRMVSDEPLSTMRLVSMTDGRKGVEIPDGTVQIFRNFGGTDWRLEVIRDRFHNNVLFAYDDTPGLTPRQQHYTQLVKVQQLPNGEGGILPPVREQKLYYDKVDEDGMIGPQTLLREVELTGPQGQTLTYTFAYAALDLVRPGWDSSQAGYLPDTEPHKTYMLRSVTNEVTHEAFTFTYDLEPDPLVSGYVPPAETGWLRRMRLPTGGYIEWDWTTILFPRPGVIKMREQQISPYVIQQRSQNRGIALRRLYDSGHTLLGTWTYKRKTAQQQNCVTEDAGLRLFHYVAAAVTGPDNVSTIVYYSTYNDIFGDCDSDIDWLAQEYASAFTHTWGITGSDGEKLWLSSEKRVGFTDFPDILPYAPQSQQWLSGQLIETTWVRNAGKIETARRTIINGDRSCGSALDAPCFSESYSTGPVGFGRFTQTSTHGNYPTGNDRTSITHWIVPSSAPGPSGLNDPSTDGWVHGLKTDECTADDSSFRAGGATCEDLSGLVLRQSFCFDTGSGFLKRQRVHASDERRDLVSEFVSDVTTLGRATGNIRYERYYGGDDNDAPPRSGFCEAETLSGTPRYALEHTYAYGVRKSSKVMGQSFFTVDNDIDPGTGLVTASRDTAGLQTSYSYDGSWRLTGVAAPGIAATAYDYHAFDPVDGSLARVTVRQDAGAAGTKETTYDYDGQGRLVRTRNRLPDDTINARMTTYDALGRKLKVGELEADTLSLQPSKYTAFDFSWIAGTVLENNWNFVTTATAPDGSVSRQVKRGGGRTTDRTVNIWTGASTPVTTSESYDPRGRLVQVIERSGPSNALAPVAGFVTTNYGYDVADHLTQVEMTGADGDGQQHRVFDYDTRGLLMREQHPEKGANGNGEVRYKYDARGHVIRKTDGTPGGAFDLAYVYDNAERLVTLNHVTAVAGTSAADPLGTPSAVEPVKEFHFADANIADDARQGKVDIAARHNRIDAGDVVVTENFEYKEAGRVSARTTAVTLGSQPIQTFRQSYTYAPWGDVATMTYPSFEGMPGGPAKVGTVTRTYHNGMLTNVADFADLTYAKNGMVEQVKHLSLVPGAQAQVDETMPDTSGMPRPGLITFSYCTGPALDPSMPKSVEQKTSEPVTLSIPPLAGTIRYQWYQGTSGDRTHPIAGATLPQVDLPLLTATTSYWVEVADDGGCPTDSRTATVTVPCAGVSVAHYPSDQKILSGQTATFSLDVTPSTVTVTWYQGRSGDATTPVGTGTTFTAGPLTETSWYWARITTAGGGCIMDTQTVEATVCKPLAIARDAVDATLFVTSPTASATPAATFSVAGGTAPYVFTWRNEAGDVLRTESLFAPTSTYSVELLAGQSRKVRVSASDNCGSTVQSTLVTLAVKSCAVIRATGIWPNVMPIGRGGQAVLLTARMDPEDLSQYDFEWFRGRDGVKLAGSGGSINVTTYSYDSFYFRATSKDDCHSVVVSPRAYVYVYGTCPVPSLVVAPPSVTVPAGGNATLQAFVDWTGITYTWYRGDSGDTRHALGGVSGHPDQLLVNDTPATYWVRATGACGSQDSATIPVSRSTSGGTCGPVVIRATSADQEIASGQTVDLFVDAGGNPPPYAYQWYQGTDNRQPLRSTGPHATVTPVATTRYWAKAFNDCGGSADSRFIALRVTSCGTSSFTQQPASASLIGAGSAHLTAAATGAVSYQWFTGDPADGDVPIANATGSSYDTPVLSSTAKYWVRATIAAGCAFDSRVAVVSVCIPARVTNGGTNIDTVPMAGAWVSFSYAGDDLHFQWYRGDSGDTSSPIDGGTADAIQVMPTQTSKYWVRVSNACGTADSPTFTVSICAGIDLQPESQTVMPGTSVTLHTHALGAFITYHWYKGLVGDRSTPVGNSADFVIGPVNDDTHYWCDVLSGGCGTATDEVVISTCKQPLVGWTGTIVTNARYNQAQVLQVGTVTTAAVTFYEGTSVGNPSGSTLLSGPAYSYGIAVAPTQTTSYWARATEGNCFFDTQLLTIHVCVPAVKTQPAASQTINAGGTATLSVVSDIPDVTYQWYAGSRGTTTAPVANGTTATITVSPSTDTTYWVRITGTCGQSADSNEALVRICVPARIMSQPTVVGVPSQPPVGTDLIVGAAGDALTYQWYQGESGVTTTPLGTAAQTHVSPTVTTPFWVRVTGSCGTVNSNSVFVSFCASITQQPTAAASAVMPGAGTTITVVAGGGYLNYQWFRGAAGDTSAPVGTNSATLATGPLTQATSFWVRITSGDCAVSSQAVTVSMCNVAVSWQAAQTQVTKSFAQTLFIDAPAGMTATWYQGTSGNVAGSTQLATGGSYALTVSPAVTTSYWVRVSDASCIGDSPTLTINVCKPTITTHPQTQTITLGATAHLSVAADIPGVTYQWYIGAKGVTTQPVSGATSATLDVSPTAQTSYWARVTGTCGTTADSNAAVVSVCRPPAITQHPVSQSVWPGNSVTLTVAATGDGLSYQWWSGTGASAVRVGTNSTSYSTVPATTTVYWCQVTGSCGTANSNNATVTVCGNMITTQPSASTTQAWSGQAVTLSVGTSGSGNHYQWFRGSASDTSAPIGSDAASISSGTLTQTTSFWVRVSNGSCTQDSNTVTVTVCTPPAAGWGSYVANVTKSYTQSLSITASVGLTPVWYTGASGNTTNPIPNTSGLYSITISPTVTTSYWVRVYNSYCYTDLPAITVNVCVPQITTHPASQSIAAGGTAHLTVAADIPNVTYQWYVGAKSVTTNPIAGATGASVDVSPASQTQYWVRVTGCAIADSNAATVSICNPPSIAAQPVSQTTWGSATLQVYAGGTGLSYQWYIGLAGDVSHPTGTNASTLQVAPASTTSYWVRVNGTCGSVNSTTATVTVCTNRITGGPTAADTIAFYGTTTTLSVTTSGTGLHYHWYVGQPGDKSQPFGTDSATVTSPPIYADTPFWVEVTNGTCTQQSNVVWVQLFQG